MLWKKQQTSLPTEPVVYPNGSYVETEKGYFYIAKPGKRYRILSRRILDSYAPPRIIKTTEAALAKYRITARLKFRAGSLIYNISDGKIFLIEDGLLRHVTSPEALARIGATEKDAVVVSKKETELHEMGEDFN